MSKQYTYAVARIHAKEGSMLKKSDIERLISAADFEEAKSILNEKGYDVTSSDGVDKILDREREKTKKLILEIIDDISVLDAFFYDIDFHNLKAAIKATAGDGKTENIFINGGTVPIEKIKQAIDNREFSLLPEFLKDTAEQALKILFETGNGSVCDTFVDKAYFETLISAGEKSGLDILKRYAELSAALSNIRIAARGAREGKNIEFFKRSLVHCKTLSVNSMATAAVKGEDELINYLKLTDYRDGTEALKKSHTAFEKWSDDKIMAELRKEKANNFSIGSIVAYILAKEVEIKMVGLVLTAKQNKLDEQKCRERLRKLYV